MMREEVGLIEDKNKRPLDTASMAQITLPDIQIKSADRVFRLYVKSLHDKAVYSS